MIQSCYWQEGNICLVLFSCYYLEIILMKFYIYTFSRSAITSFISLPMQYGVLSTTQQNQTDINKKKSPKNMLNKKCPRIDICRAPNRISDHELKFYLSKIFVFSWWYRNAESLRKVDQPVMHEVWQLKAHMWDNQMLFTDHSKEQQLWKHEFLFFVLISLKDFR